MKQPLNEEWTAEVVGRMHRCRITQTMLANQCDYTSPYLCMVLNGKKKFESEKAKERTKAHIFRALEELEHDRLKRN